MPPIESFEEVEPRGFLPRRCEVDLSAVITCYFEEKSIDEFYSRLASTLESMPCSSEILFVNDGSTDGTWARLCDIFERDTRVSAVIDLFKNSGQANAATPGIMLARGRAILLLDSDLQLDPEELPTLWREFEAGAHVVSGCRRDRRDSAARKLPSLLANVIMRRASSSKLRDFGCTYKIYDGTLVRGFDFGPAKPWRPVPVIAAAGHISEVDVTHHARRFGESGWTFRKLFAYNMENLVNLSGSVFQYLGAVCFFLALLFVLRIGVSFFSEARIVEEVTPGLILNFGVVALLTLLAVLAAIGEFVIRNFIALQRKPAFIVREMRRRPPMGVGAPS
jgi:glycosyltransferase involved in cell wall biosynthesis